MREIGFGGAVRRVELVAEATYAGYVDAAFIR